MNTNVNESMKAIMNTNLNMEVNMHMYRDMHMCMDINTTMNTHMAGGAEPWNMVKI